MTEQFKQRQETYLGDHSLYASPKEITKLLVRLVSERAKDGDGLLDVGCGVGELLHHARRTLPGLHVAGLDVTPALIDQARAVPGLAGVDLRLGDARTFRYQDFGPRPFDFITCSGVLSIDDDFGPLLGNLIDNVRGGGVLYIFSLFNDDDIDVRVRYRDNAYDPERWQLGYNTFSVGTMSRWLEGRVKAFRFLPFEIPVEVPRRPQYPHRAWTITTSDGRRRMVNGLGLMCLEQILEIVV